MGTAALDLDGVGATAEDTVEVVGGVGFVVFHQHCRLTKAVPLLHSAMSICGSSGLRNPMV